MNKDKEQHHILADNSFLMENFILCDGEPKDFWTRVIIDSDNIRDWNIDYLKSVTCENCRNEFTKMVRSRMFREQYSSKNWEKIIIAVMKMARKNWNNKGKE